MADYKTIFGQKIQSVATDPSVAIPGQVWYNSTSATVKANIFYNGVWSTGSAAMNTGRKNVGSAGVGSTAGVVAGGITLMPNGQQQNQNATETYDGSTWTTANAINSTRRGLGSAGVSSTAALIFGGYQDPYTGSSESWNGSNWTSTPSLNSSRDNIGGGGTSTSALAIAGQQGTSITSQVESYNGSSWTVGTTNPAANHLWISAAGKSNSDVLAWGGKTYSGGYTAYATCLLWDGSSWTNKNPTVNTGRTNSGNTCASTNSIVSYGGEPTTATEIWDGTCWTAGNALPVEQNSAGSNGSGPSGTAAWYAGGSAPTITSPADEGWTGMQIYQYGAEKITLAST